MARPTSKVNQRYDREPARQVPKGYVEFTGGVTGKPVCIRAKSVGHFASHPSQHGWTQLQVSDLLITVRHPYVEVATDLAAALRK